MKIKDIEKEKRPREKALRFGMRSLSDVELLALILQSGNKNHTVFEIAEDVLHMSNSLANLFDLYPNQLMEIPGIREGKALQILASIELCKRAMQAHSYQVSIDKPEDIVKWFELEYGYEKQEHFVVLYLDAKGHIISHRVMFKGTLTESCVHPRDIYKEAFLESANSVLCIHNHPSGDCTPSKADIQCTKQIASIAYMMGITFLDHIIVGRNTWFSFRQSEILIE